jgi:hypothetical protein
MEVAKQDRRVPEQDGEVAEQDRGPRVQERCGEPSLSRTRA